MANGRVVTGFSKPYVAKYNFADDTITYSNGMPLARGVSVKIEPDDDTSTEEFNADNVLAESDSSSTFSGATLTLTVDGLKTAAETMIQGLGSVESGWIDYDDNQSAPYVGVGFIARYMEDGKTTYVPMLLYKCKFNKISNSFDTGEKGRANFQSQELSASVIRSDMSSHAWKSISASAYDTEALAESALKTKLGIA